MNGIQKNKRLQYVDAQWANLDLEFFSTTYPSGFLAFLVCSHPIDLVKQRRMSLPLLVPLMTMDEEEEFRTQKRKKKWSRNHDAGFNYDEINE